MLRHPVLGANHAATRRAASRYLESNSDCMTSMARVRGAAARPLKAAAAQFPTSRVDPAALEKFRRAREARNCSFSLMTEELLQRVIWDEQGQLVGLLPADAQQETPLKSA